jgi:hypothetical protein
VRIIREILRASSIGMQAQAELLDADDKRALGHPRRYWIDNRASLPWRGGAA